MAESPSQLQPIDQTVNRSELGLSVNLHLARRLKAAQTTAAQSGWEVVGLYEDAGISAKGRDKRPGFDRLLKDTTARKIDMIAAWSVDLPAAACRIWLAS
jgi:DNA invertase Pin-like site-specific DNA recombinase